MGDVTIPQYLLSRLEQLNVQSVFGVPGDFNLAFLDVIDDHKSINWVGCTNELNAAYATDGYSRSKRTLGVLVTTFGVGELSAVNGIAGAFSEHIPILHVVGVPSTKLQAHKAILHHTLGDGRFDAFTSIYKHVSAATVLITSAQGDKTGRSAGEKIDYAIETALRECRPTYLSIPTDLVDCKISSAPLKDPLNWKHISAEPRAEELIVERAVELIKKSRNPVILIDACAKRFSIQDLCLELVDRTGIPFFTSPMGKGAISEDHPLFGGVYVGSVSTDTVRKRVETADMLISIGALKSDFNTGSFSYRTTSEQTIELHSDHTRIRYAYYENAGFKSLLPKLVKALEPYKEIFSSQQNILKGPSDFEPEFADDKKITQDAFWKTWEQFFRKGDIILGETGTSCFGLLDVKFPSDAIWISQILWGSIGYTGPSAFGAALGAREEGKGRRTLLFIGDGSLQLVVQEISNIIRLKLPVTIIVINNDGYTIERKIHGETREYNDIQPWDWQGMLSFFGAQKDDVDCYKVSTPKELKDLQGKQSFQDSKKTQLLEVIMDKQDAPRALRMQAKMTGAANSEA